LSSGDFLHLHFKGRTTTPWHVGKRRYSNYLYTRDDYLWGRGIRGPLLRQLWRTFCPKSGARDGLNFKPERDCSVCSLTSKCPFINLRGSPDEGEFKDRPRLIITNLWFVGGVEKGRVALATLDERYLGVVEEKAPVFVEFIREGAKFEFEVILMGDGVRFADEVESAIKVSLEFHGWGGFCNEVFGRGVIESVRKHGFNSFEYKYVDGSVKSIMDELRRRGSRLRFRISPLLIIDKDSGGFYKSILEKGFSEKFLNCVNERYWQFYRRHIHVQDSLLKIFGRARTIMIRGWSRKTGGEKVFRGIGNEVVLQFGGELGFEEARALALMRYGVGRYKNQGFGTLTLDMSP